MSGLSNYVTRRLNDLKEEFRNEAKGYVLSAIVTHVSEAPDQQSHLSGPPEHYIIGEELMRDKVITRESYVSIAADSLSSHRGMLLMGSEEAAIAFSKIAKKASRIAYDMVECYGLNLPPECRGMGVSAAGGKNSIDVSVQRWLLLVDYVASLDYPASTLYVLVMNWIGGEYTNVDVLGKPVLPFFRWADDIFTVSEEVVDIIWSMAEQSMTEQQGVDSDASELNIEENRTSGDQRKNLFKHKGGIWDLAYESEEGGVRDQSGMLHIQVLLRNPNKAFTVIEMIKAAALLSDERTPAVLEIIEKESLLSGDLIASDEVMDSYGEHLKEIDSELEDARKYDDAAAISRLQKDKESIIDSLRKIGILVPAGKKPEWSRLAGPSRRTLGSEYEKHRKRIGQALGRAIKAIEKQGMPFFAEHLKESIPQVYSGMNLRYSPDPPVKWDFE